MCMCAGVDSLCHAVLGQESSASFSVPHQSHHRCNETEKMSVFQKKNESTQVLISSMFYKDLLLFL